MKIPPDPIDLTTPNLFAMNDPNLDEAFPQGYPKVFFTFELTECDSVPRCQECGAILPRRQKQSPPRVSRIIGENCVWPDILRARNWYWIAITDKVADDFRKENLTGFTLFPLDFSILPKAKHPPFSYYWLMPTGQAFFISYYNGVPFPICKRCGQELKISQFSTGERLLVNWCLDSRSWDGSDFITPGRPGLPGSDMAMCSGKVIDAARKYRWSGAFFYPVVNNLGDDILVIDHTAENWLELLDYDIRLINAKRELVEITETVWKDMRQKVAERRRAGIPLLPTPRPTPIYPPGFVPVQSEPSHPFESLQDFDGCGWQAPGALTSKLVCDYGDLFVVEDESSAMFRKWKETYDDTIRPSKKTREAFDFIVAHEEQVLPEVQRIVREQLQRLRTNLVLPNPVAGMAALRDFFMNGGDLTLWDPVKRGRGDAQLGFTLCGDPPRDSFSIWLHFDLNAGTLAVKEVEEK